MTVFPARRAWRGLTGLILAAVVTWALPGDSAARQPLTDLSDGCPPAAGLQFLCGITNGEDMVLLPGTKWLIVGGVGVRDNVGPTGALRLVDTTTKRWKQWYPTWRQWYPADRSNSFDPTAFDPRCGGPPPPGLLRFQGLSLRPRGPRRFELYAVNHAGADRSAGNDRVEVFDLDARGAEPTLKWKGCTSFPGRANSVAAAPNGDLYVTVTNLAGTTRADYMKGLPTGAVYHWRPSDKTFTPIPRMSLGGNNGVEISRDGATLYVVDFAGKGIVGFSLKDPGRPPVKAQFTGFWPDNVHWDAYGRLASAGNNYNYDECGGRELEGSPKVACARTYTVGAVDPSTMRTTVLASGPVTPAFGNAASAMAVGNEVWIGPYVGDRIAYLPAPARRARK